MLNPENILEEIIGKLNIIDGADIPAIDLYMDQVTTFMDKHLSGSKRFDDDKILTKTMINNYSKNELLPPPIKKRYSKQHVILLIFIYYLKNILSISDINTILSPICESYFGDNNVCSLEAIYNESCKIEAELIRDIKDDISGKIEASHERFNELPDKDRNFLQLYSLIFSLCFDVYIKKQMIEGIVDSMNALSENSNSDTKAKESKKENKKQK